jgi:tetrahydromethanopterin S-methyltransferase subunit C
MIICRKINFVVRCEWRWAGRRAYFVVGVVGALAGDHGGEEVVQEGIVAGGFLLILFPLLFVLFLLHPFIQSKNQRIQSYDAPLPIGVVTYMMIVAPSCVHFDLWICGKPESFSGSCVNGVAWSLLDAWACG